MERALREELLRRYVSGEMSIGEEHEFFIQVALDRELRHELKAQQEIDGAFASDRSTPTFAEYSSMQNGVAASLPQAAGAADGASAPAEPVVRTGIRIGRFTLSPMATSVGILLIAALAAITIGLTMTGTTEVAPTVETTNRPAPNPGVVVPDRRSAPLIQEKPNASIGHSEGSTSSDNAHAGTTRSPTRSVEEPTDGAGTPPNRAVNDSAQSAASEERTGRVDKHGTQQTTNEEGPLKVKADVQWGDDQHR